ncbi:MAG: hypothetical protein QOF26_1978 [Baekduia sp.]|nr:hypothetical protein [Baekduia sp.]
MASGPRDARPPYGVPDAAPWAMGPPPALGLVCPEGPLAGGADVVLDGAVAPPVPGAADGPPAAGCWPVCGAVVGAAGAPVAPSVPVAAGVPGALPVPSAEEVVGADVSSGATNPPVVVSYFGATVVEDSTGVPALSRRATACGA